ncbi:predicted protein [Naegleria gruberi]|uniref:Predicted protein n=1 Tax=Naegleria gruberi TaxID=5762 RepID=D2VKS1_NAEGR|nr:uncharacterized protein NAEGRDRAFT_69492 [Naegleria gruberi]EFC42742.1 predicted protein [Naegleria gruberi]|eukprot:XP_002675486.1 predicted protein [Naegleria gruberi strain NEG-M]
MKRSLASSNNDENVADENKFKKAKMMMATDAMLNCPGGVFVAPNDEIYIADNLNHRVRKILKDGTIVTIAGIGEEEGEGFSGDGGPATSAQFNHPCDVFVSSTNEVYISDFGNYRIRKILRNGNIVTIAGTGEEGYSGDGGPAINAQISAVNNIFVSQNDEVYFSDFRNHRIRKILRNGTIVTIAGTGEQGFSGDGGPAINAKLNTPCGVFVSNNDEVYIVDYKSHRIRKMLQDGTIITIAGTGEQGFGGDGGPATSAQLSHPCGVFVSSTNEVYITDSYNYRIRKILRNGNITTIAGTGVKGYSGDGGLAINAQISYVENIFVSQNDEVYIADTNNHRIRKILKDGTIETIAGNGEKGFGGDSPFDFSSHPHIGNDYTIIPKIQLKKHSRDELFGLNLIGFIPLIEKLSPQFSTKAMLNCPGGVFVAPNDEVYMADCQNHRVRKILKDGTIVTIAGTGEEGFSGDGDPATSAQLSHPCSVFVSSTNEVFFADSGNYRIRKILRNGNIVTIAGTGEKGYSGDGRPAINAQISYVQNIFVSQNDEIYFSDFGNHRIRKILRNGTIVTIAGTGEKGFSGDGGPATSAQLDSPCGVFVSNNDEVYIVDYNNHRIRKILRNGIINTIAGTGEEGFSGDGGPAINAQVNHPCGVFVSSTNEVYIMNSGNYRIRKILRNANITTIAGTGVKGYSGDGGLAINAQISYVDNIFVSRNDEVYIADTENHRIRKILRNGTIKTIAGNGEEGFGGDSPFDFSSHPHIGNDYTIIPKIQLKKHSRDELFGLELIGFIPLIEKLSPQFCKIILKNEKLLKSMNSQQIRLKD